MLRMNAMHGKRLPLVAYLILALLAFGGCRRSPEVKKAKFMESAKAFMDAKDYRRAILQYRNAVQYAGKDAKPYYELALAYLADGQPQNAGGALQQAIKIDSHFTEAQLKLAELQMRFGGPKDRSEAEKSAKKILASSPDNVDALSTLALAEFYEGKPGEAERHLEEALQKSPQNVKAAVTMADLKIQQKDLKGAEQVLQTAVQRSPKSVDALIALARFYLATQKWPEAERNLQQALQIDPKNESALFGLAAAQMRMGQNDKAEQTYARISALPPARYKTVHAQFLLYEGKRDEGKRAAATAELAKLFKDNPDDRDVRTLLVKAYWMANKKEEAQKVLDQAVKHNPKDVDALLQRAEMRMSFGKLPDAQADLEQVLRYRPESDMGHYLRARVYGARGDRTLQRQELSEALRLNKGMLAARLGLAETMWQQGDGKGALALLDSQDKEYSNQQRLTLPVFVLRNYALISTGDYATAQRYVDALLTKVKTPDLFIQDAYIKKAKKDYAGARASLESALKMNPQDLRALELLARSYVEQKQIPLGTQKFREFAATQPKSAIVQKFLGDWLVGTGDHQGALQAYQAAEQLDPKFTPAGMAMARLYLADNKLDAAKQTLTRLRQSGTDSAEIFLWIGVTDEKQGDFAGATDNYHRVLEHDSNNVMALNNLAFLLAEHGKPQDLDEALKLAQQVRAMVPKSNSNSSNIGDTMGWVYYRKEIYPSAVQQFQQAVEDDREFNRPSALHCYHLAMAYAKVKDFKRGNEQLSAGLKINPNLPEAKKAMELLAPVKTASN